MNTSFSATKSRVANRGVPPDGFLRELVEWGRTAPAEIFAPNAANDVYSAVKAELGPFAPGLHRRAVMLEVLRVLAGFESSWNWNDGRDVTNATSNRPETEEAGAWQVSANSVFFGRDLRALVEQDVRDMDGDGDRDADDFRAAMKLDHPLAMEYVARLLRHTIRHNGTVKRGEINPWLRRGAVAEFERLIA